MGRGYKYNWSKELIEKAVKESYCYKDVLRKLSINTIGKNSDTLKRKIEEYGIDISHFTFVSHNKGKKQKKSIETYLTQYSTIASSKLRLKLINEGIKENKCEKCGISIWMGKPITIQLHHKNGDHSDNRLDNLQLLCPNCHSQTENFCGTAKEKYFCMECGRQLKTKAKLCVSCSAKRARRELWTERIKSSIEKGLNNVEMADVFNVSETTIRHWRKKLNL